MLITPAAPEIIETGSPLFIEIDGQRVPFFLEDYDPVSAGQAIAKFEFIDSIEEARKVKGCDVYMESPGPLPGGSPGDDFSSIIGYQAFDLAAGHLGTVSGFVQDEMNPLFLVSGRGGEIMIPAQDELIMEINRRRRIIRFDLPEGLSGL